MEPDRTPARGRTAPLAQVALAAVVAGSMLTFSALAFRTGILDDGSGGVRPTTRSAGNDRAVVLPAATAEPEVAGRRERRVPDRILVSEIDPGTDVVLGTKIDRPDGSAAKVNRRNRNHGDGHDKARGKGHHKRNGKGHHENHEAREEDDDRDDHGPDDDDDDDDHSESSRSRSGHRSRGSSGSNSGRSRA